MTMLAPEPRRGYRRCVGIALFSREGHVFLGKRAQRGVVPQFSWQMPQGGVDEGEDPLQAASRELYEETRVSSTRYLGEVEGWLHYDLPRELAAWKGRYRGQAQRWFAFRFTGGDEEIDVANPPDGHHVEFSRWRWEALEKTPEVVVPFKRDVYEHVAAAFASYAVPEEVLRDLAPKAI
jgi:putative (di)nucleoside polyphosphate hydrolase